MTLDELLEGFRAGNRGALARLLSYVENEQAAARRAVADLYRSTGRASVVGVTGPPGAGKSTLTRALIEAYRSRGNTVAVLAFDPSSALSGGAALGDRIRMLDLWDDEGVFVRSMATRGHHGGLSLAASSAIHLLDAYGFDVILVETVGVGQGEVDIARVADTTILLQVPGLGDTVQTIKAGILEIADILVVNKADLPDAGKVVEDLRSMTQLYEHGGWRPPILQTVASRAEGVDDLITAIEQHREFLLTTSDGQRIARNQVRDEVAEIVRRELNQSLKELVDDPDLDEQIQAVLDREQTPYDVALAVKATLVVDRSQHQ